jgi:hypothetical protein
MNYDINGLVWRIMGRLDVNKNSGLRRDDSKRPGKPGENQQSPEREIAAMDASNRGLPDRY